ncbi:hypothetical protein [Streptomyces sp. NPDC048172]|uniref:hypothetical protein n=1 Tax=Streptomyces sp. NPDC048172 TaxID=3365505 RepID=UPI00371F18D8
MRSAVGKARVGTVLTVSMATGLLALGQTPAVAGNGDGTTDTTEQAPATGNPSNTIGSLVTFKGNAPKGGTPMAAPAGVEWKPPACWYEPMWKPKEYKKAMEQSNPPGAVLGDYEEEFYAYKDKRKKQKYNVGKDGLWWSLKYDSDRDYEGAGCLAKDPDLWVPKGEPPEDPAALDPEMLAKLAYKQTKLPAPPVTLRPASGKQVVNLETHVGFKAPLDRVWVTASIDHMGVDLAATTVATPASLKVSAGTADADPANCTYDLKKGEKGYEVDSEDAGCNITYRRSSGKGTHPFKASLVWKVTWTDSADPDGPAQQPALPDGQSEYEQDVTVKEIQSIVRD